jgi:hypothetical protein
MAPVSPQTLYYKNEITLFSAANLEDEGGITAQLRASGTWVHSHDTIALNGTYEAFRVLQVAAHLEHQGDIEAQLHVSGVQVHSA